MHDYTVQGPATARSHHSFRAIVDRLWTFCWQDGFHYPPKRDVGGGTYLNSHDHIPRLTCSGCPRSCFLLGRCHTFVQSMGLQPLVSTRQRERHASIASAPIPSLAMARTNRSHHVCLPYRIRMRNQTTSTSKVRQHSCRFGHTWKIGLPPTTAADYASYHCYGNCVVLCSDRSIRSCSP